MKLATFATGSRVSYGIVTGGGLVDIGARLSASLPDVAHVLEQGALGLVSEFSGAPADSGSTR